MMGIEDKTLLCFCHWGRRNKVLPDESIWYGGGITDQVVAKKGIKYNDFVNAVFDRLGIDPSDKMLHFTVKFDRLELIRLRDQEGIDTLLQFNDGYAHVYASSLEKEPYSRPRSGGTKKIEHIIASDKQPDTTPVGDDLNNNKCGDLSKAAVDKLPPHQDNEEPFVEQNNIQNDPSALFSYRNYHGYKQLTSSGIQEMFWTKLPNQGTSRMTGDSAGFPPTQTGSQQVAATTKVACKIWKRFRKQTAESSDSDDTSINVETEDAESENGNNPPARQGI